MKIIVISDTHGNMHRLKDVVEKNKDADLFLHLGDGAEEFFEVQEMDFNGLLNRIEKYYE